MPDLYVTCCTYRFFRVKTGVEKCIPNCNCTYFPNAFLAKLHTSLTLTFTQCRQKFITAAINPTVAKHLQVSYCTASKIFL